MKAKRSIHTTRAQQRYSSHDYPGLFLESLQTGASDFRRVALEGAKNPFASGVYIKIKCYAPAPKHTFEYLYLNFPSDSVAKKVLVDSILGTT